MVPVAAPGREQWTPSSEGRCSGTSSPDNGASSRRAGAIVRWGREALKGIIILSGYRFVQSQAASVDGAEPSGQLVDGTLSAVVKS